MSNVKVFSGLSKSILDGDDVSWKTTKMYSYSSGTYFTLITRCRAHSDIMLVSA